MSGNIYREDWCIYSGFYPDTNKKRLVFPFGFTVISHSQACLNLCKVIGDVEALRFTHGFMMIKSAINGRQQGPTCSWQMDFFKNQFNRCLNIIFCNEIFMVQKLTTLFEYLSAISFHETLKNLWRISLQIIFLFSTSLFKKECIDWVCKKMRQFSSAL